VLPGVRDGDGGRACGRGTVGVRAATASRPRHARRPQPRLARDAGLRIARELFAAWQDYQADSDRARLQAQIAPLQEKLRALLEHAARKSPRTKYHRDFARNLLKRWPALWTFTHTDGVEPTNNHVERGLRGAIIYRKLSLGSQSDQGERTIERLLSASISCRLRRQSLFAYLTQAVAAHARGDPVPTLA
jgi:transposase